MNKAGANDWKTPLGYYEMSIEELRRTREELQEELANFKATYKPSIETSLYSFQTEIQTLKSELKITQERLATTEKSVKEARDRLADAETAAHATQIELQAMKEIMTNEQTTNSQILEGIAQLKEQLSQLPQIQQKPTTDENNLQRQILHSLSNLQLQFSKLEAKLTIVSPSSGFDYSKLQELLAENKWNEADIETYACMLRVCEREEERWLDDKDIKRFSRQDLRIIENLWIKYSDGKFGFSAQKRTWLDAKEDYKRFGDRVGWLENLVNSEWRKYEDYIFSLSAPEGHLPSTVRVLGLGCGNVGWLQHRLKIFLSRY
ncbi:GUN4 domain-containing protein [Iningainema tapete]|uniref:GUN4 domain-containing protein n=1 Tax=Iningainema tapete BLCC-T55 TaxID=2748662 RepID=A0A8J6XHW0_9CYAN|nr:GUN4 domain-containing protein [Iningainema tapete]MBD2772992.1 GUN4 domain-containing protein [Iningainema tapete BLCC-T55]